MSACGTPGKNVAYKVSEGIRCRGLRGIVRQKLTPTLVHSLRIRCKKKSAAQIKTEMREQSQKEGMEIGAPEARHRFPVSSKDSNKTDLLHLGPCRGRRVVCSTRLGERTKVHLTSLEPPWVPTKRKPRCNQGSIIIGARRPGKLADIRRVKTVREVTGSPNQEDTDSGLTKLPRESIDSYEDLRTAFRENYLQQTKHIKDPVEIHHIKQRDGESTEDFMERYKAEILDVEGAPECMKISGFMHGITHPELIKRLYEKIPRSMDEMYRVTTSFLQGEVAAFSHSRKKAPAPWKQPEGGNKPNFKKGFKNKQRSDRKPDRFSLLTKTPKEIFALEKGKFKAPPPMVTPAEKRDPNKYCEFHADTGHSTDECMQLRKQIDEMIKSGKLSQFIKELKQSDKPKAQKKGETAGKDKPLAILMIQPWERVAKQRVTQSFSPETIISFPSLGEEDGTEGPMIIEAEIGGHFVHRIYVDGGASSEVLYEHCFVRLRPEIRSQMIPATTSLIGFSGETIWPIGQISLLVKIGDEEHSTSAWMNFMVIRSPSQHNGIIGRTGIRKIRAVPSTAHGMLKFPVKGGTVTIRSSRVIPMECAMISGPSTQHPVTSQVLEEKIKVAIHPEYPEQTIAIGSTLTEKGRKELCALLRQNLDVFAWKPADMTGVPRHMAEHRLNVREGCPPVRQKKRGQAPERNKAIQEEVEKLVDAGIMKEVHYHSWLSNPVMVKKHDGSWRMCVDFKDLNKACPQDGYPLPEIDWKVESLCGYPFKCFLDAYKGYHQIKMAEEDEEKTAFITSQGIFCYTKMSFGLKNVGATYQRLVDMAF
ncbi:reverse transcriptase domain-containing protein [Tanacetum coccineum]